VGLLCENQKFSQSSTDSSGTRAVWLSYYACCGAIVPRWAGLEKQIINGELTGIEHRLELEQTLNGLRSGGPCKPLVNAH
jgi:hypothetical protein